jgi:hypothetical protein
MEGKVITVRFDPPLRDFDRAWPELEQRLESEYSLGLELDDVERWLERDVQGRTEWYGVRVRLKARRAGR